MDSLHILLVNLKVILHLLLLFFLHVLLLLLVRRVDPIQQQLVLVLLLYDLQRLGGFVFYLLLNHNDGLPILVLSVNITLLLPHHVLL